MDNNITETNGPIVLVAEDDAVLSSMYKSKLTKEGFDVILATNGENGIKMAREKKPDIILLDLIMPVKDGFETLKELKADPTLKDIKVVILSNLSQEEDKKRVLDMGAVDYVVKANISLREMVALVRQYLGVV
jgi:DNA-binding response OmpR family regulator